MNDDGHLVYQVLTDFQNNTLASTGGDGWLRFMEFDMDSDSIHFSTYSPTLQEQAGMNGAYTFNQAPGFSDFTLPMPAQVVCAKSSQPGRSARDLPRCRREMMQ